MESERFDAMTRSVASRRSLLAKAGGGGFGAILLGAFGLREEAAAATSCLLDVRLFVRVGPSTGFPLVAKQPKTGELDGQLRLRISSKGDLAGSAFVLGDGSSFPVAGSVTGHLVGLRIALAQGQTLVLQGVDEGNVSSCKGTIDGGLVGPREGDLGDWHATVVPTTATKTATAAATTGGQTVAPTPIPANASGANGSSQPTETTTEPPTPTATTTAAPTDTPAATSTPMLTSCPECQSAEAVGLNSSGGCHPVTDGTPCSGGGACCGGLCWDISSDHLNCGACYNVCATDCCQNGVCCPPPCPSGQTLCGGCVDLSSDPSNCGACGNVCDAGAVCTNGACKKIVICPAGWINCGGTCFHGKICP